MGITKYRARGKTYWEVDVWKGVDGKQVRFRRGRILSRVEAERVAVEAKVSGGLEPSSAKRFSSTTVADAWRLYEPVGQRDNRAWSTDQGRAKHLIRHLGHNDAAALSIGNVDAYRSVRLSERTRRGGPPSPATLDREVELLKRTLNYAVAAGRIATNPLARAKLLRRPNVRRSVLDESAFSRLYRASEVWLQPVLLLAFDTGMRKQEVLQLHWDAVSIPEASIRLWPDGTKSEEARLVVLTPRALQALKALRPHTRAEPVFRNPETGKPYQDIRKTFRRAVAEAELRGLWFHDLRRSFVTRARKAGVPESVVMRMSGHKTRSVFDRYNCVDEGDLRRAVTALSSHDGRSLDALPGTEVTTKQNAPV